MNNDKVLRMIEVSSFTGLSPSTISRLEKSDKFPRRRRIGIKAVGWLESEVMCWIGERIQAQPKTQGGFSEQE